MNSQMREFLLDYLDDVEQRRWEYEATVKAAEERRKNDKPVNTRNLHEAKRKIAFYDHLRALINDDTTPEQRWVNRYQAILGEFLQEHDDAISTVKASPFTDIDEIFVDPPSNADQAVWNELKQSL